MALTWVPMFGITLMPQDIEVTWLMLLEDFGPATTWLKLKATGTWTPLAGVRACGPDGLIGQSFSDDRMIISDCPVGALIGRIGGSSATIKVTTPASDAGEGKPFPIGSYAIAKLPDKAVGPLFVGFNILLRPMKLDRLELVVEAGS